MEFTSIIGMFELHSGPVRVVVVTHYFDGGFCSIRSDFHEFPPSPVIPRESCPLINSPSFPRQKAKPLPPHFCLKRSFNDDATPSNVVTTSKKEVAPRHSDATFRNPKVAHFTQNLTLNKMGCFLLFKSTILSWPLGAPRLPPLPCNPYTLSSP